MSEFKRNVVVKADKRGRLHVFVGGQHMAGITKVTHTADWSEPAGRLVIEVTGYCVDFFPADFEPEGEG